MNLTRFWSLFWTPFGEISRLKMEVYFEAILRSGDVDFLYRDSGLEGPQGHPQKAPGGVQKAPRVAQKAVRGLI